VEMLILAVWVTMEGWKERRWKVESGKLEAPSNVLEGRKACQADALPDWLFAKQRDFRAE